MGANLGCAQGACCATDGNVDLHTQVDTNKNRQLVNSNSTAQSRATELIPKSGVFDESVLHLPVGHSARAKYDAAATKINAYLRGFYQRIIYKRIYFMYLVTGMKAHQFSSEELAKVPRSEV
jgi:hypothetical protein